MSNKTNKQARQLAKQLPVVYVHVPKMVTVRGAAILKHPDKYKTKVNHKEIVPEFNYTATIKVVVPCNHVVRIMEANKKGGDEEVAKHVAWVRSANKLQQQELKKQLPQKKSLLTKLRTGINKIINQFKTFIWSKANNRTTA